MDMLDLFQRLGIALAIGLLVGVERGWREREGKPGSRTAGVRTHALIGLLGGVWGALVPHVGEIALGFSVLAFGGAFAAFKWRETAAEGDFSVTGVIGAYLVFALGAYAVLGEMVIAVAVGVTTAAILAAREPMHHFLARVTWPELRSALVLLAMTFVLLPILPNYAVDPWGAINPYELWLLTILIAAMSYAGYIAVRVAGDRTGLIYAGAAGGLVSSTIVTLTYARLAAGRRDASPQFAATIAASWAVSLVRMAALAIVVTPGIALALAPPVGAGVAVLAAATAYFVRRARGDDGSALGFTNPFELLTVARVAAALAVVIFAAKLLVDAFGHAGLLSLAAVSGAVDVDPITLTAARLAGASVTYVDAALAILVAGAANLTIKAGMAVALGGSRFGLVLAGAAAAAVAGGSAMLLIISSV